MTAIQVADEIGRTQLKEVARFPHDIIASLWLFGLLFIAGQRPFSNWTFPQDLIANGPSLKRNRSIVDYALRRNVRPPPQDFLPYYDKGRRIQVLRFCRPALESSIPRNLGMGYRLHLRSLRSGDGSVGILLDEDVGLAVALDHRFSSTITLLAVDLRANEGVLWRACYGAGAPRRPEIGRS
jgi:hypothetical protein